MLIRKLLNYLMLLGLSGILGACAGEEMPYFTPTEVQFEGSSCLNETFSKFDQFIEGELSNPEVAEFWDCASTAISTVEKRVVGTGPDGSFKGTDLQWFVGRYFLDAGKPGGIEISDVLLDEMMEIKRQFLGGSRLVLTREEIAETKVLIREFKKLSLDINPYIKMLFYDDEKSNPSQTDLGRGIGFLAKAVFRVGELVAQQKNSYELDRISRLIEELDAIFEEKGKELPDWTKYIPTARRVKGLLLNSSEDLIEFNEWTTVARVLSQGLSIVFRAKYFFEEEALYRLQTVLEFQQMFEGVQVILEEALGRRNGEAISNEDVDSIVDSLEESDLMPDFLDVEQIKKLWRVLVDQVLTPEDPREDGLAGKEVENLAGIFDEWYLVQRWLLGEPQPDELVAEMSRVLNTPWAYRTDQYGRMLFDDNRDERVPNIESSSALNWERAAFNLVLRGYSGAWGDPEAPKGLTKDEVDLAFADLRPIFVELGLVEPDDEGFIDRTYLQAALFVPRSNGDFYFDLFEMIEYTHFVLAGIKMGERFVDNLPPGCRNEEDEDLITYYCWQESFREFFADYYDNMPFMVDFITDLNNLEFETVIAALEGATRKGDTSTEFIKASHIYEAGIFLQYIETLMMRFDMDRSGYLETQEGFNAVPLFTPQVRELVGLANDHEAKIILTFMMRYGAPPDPANPISLLRYLHWRLSEKDWKFVTGRFKVISILASLNEL